MVTESWLGPSMSSSFGMGGVGGVGSIRSYTVSLMPTLRLVTKAIIKSSNKVLNDLIPNTVTRFIARVLMSLDWPAL